MRDHADAAALNVPPLGAEKRVAQRARARTIRERPVTFRCAWCDQVTTELRFPGPTPAYGAACRAEALRYREACKKARQRGAEPPARQRTTSCRDSPQNLITVGFIDPDADELSDALRRSLAIALEARDLARSDPAIRRFLEECGL